jgi:hypothetical protein
VDGGGTITAKTVKVADDRGEFALLGLATCGVLLCMLVVATTLTVLRCGGGGLITRCVVSSSSARSTWARTRQRLPPR